MLIRTVPILQQHTGHLVYVSPFVSPPVSSSWIILFSLHVELPSLSFLLALCTPSASSCWIVVNICAILHVMQVICWLLSPWWDSVPTMWSKLSIYPFSSKCTLIWDGVRKAKRKAVQHEIVISTLLFICYLVNQYSQCLVFATNLVKFVDKKSREKSRVACM